MADKKTKEYQVVGALCQWFEEVPQVDPWGKPQFDPKGNAIVSLAPRNAGQGEIVKIDAEQGDLLVHQGYLQKPGAKLLPTDAKFVPDATPFGAPVNHTPTGDGAPAPGVTPEALALAREQILAELEADEAAELAAQEGDDNIEDAFPSDEAEIAKWVKAHTVEEIEAILPDLDGAQIAAVFDAESEGKKRPTLLTPLEALVAGTPAE